MIVDHLELHAGRRRPTVRYCTSAGSSGSVPLTLGDSVIE